MAIVNSHIASLSIISITIILAAGIVSVVALTEFVSVGIAQGQVNNITSSSITPQQKAAMCNPGNPKLKFVNSTESKICGIPPTPKNTTSTSTANTTRTTGTGTETPSQSGTSSILPSDTTPTIPKQSRLYEQGYAKGVTDAKSVQITTPPTGTMSPDDVDCDSDIEPHMSNPDYCSGYQYGYADTYYNEVLGK